MDLSRQYARMLGRLRAARNRPAAMAEFEAMYEGPGWAGALMELGRPIVGYTCSFLPEELVLAAGAVPVRLDVGLGGSTADEEIGPICNVARTVARMPRMLPGLFERMELFVLPSTCDAMRALLRRGDWGVDLLPLEIPAGRYGDRARRSWLEQVEVLCRRLGKIGRLRRKNLLAACEKVGRKADMVRRLEAQLGRGAEGFDYADLALVLDCAWRTDLDWWLDSTGRLLEELESRPAGRFEPRARLVLAGTPVMPPELAIPLIVRDLRASIVADDLCTGAGVLRNPPVIDEPTFGGLIAAVAERVMLPSPCPCQNDGRSTSERLANLARTAGAQGVVYHRLLMCQLHAAESARQLAPARKRGVGWLDLHFEFGEKDEARLRNRLEAFIEMLSEQKARRNVPAHNSTGSSR